MSRFSAVDRDYPVFASSLYHSLPDSIDYAGPMNLSPVKFSHLCHSKRVFEQLRLTVHGDKML